MAEIKQKAKKGKKTRKFGRNARWCVAYRARNQRERNKVTRLRRHLNRFSKDRCANDALVRYREFLGMRVAA